MKTLIASENMTVKEQNLLTALNCVPMLIGLGGQKILAGKLPTMQLEGQLSKDQLLNRHALNAEMKNLLLTMKITENL